MNDSAEGYGSTPRKTRTNDAAMHAIVVEDAGGASQAYPTANKDLKAHDRQQNNALIGPCLHSNQHLVRTPVKTRSGPRLRFESALGTNTNQNSKWTTPPRRRYDHRFNNARHSNRRGKPLGRGAKYSYAKSADACLPLMRAWHRSRLQLRRGGGQGFRPATLDDLVSDMQTQQRN